MTTSFAKRRRALYWQSTIFVLMTIGLVCLNLLTYPGHIWAVYPIAGWGLALVMQYHELKQLRTAPVETPITALPAPEEAWMPAAPPTPVRRFEEYDSQEFV